jgi:hypothetical protein
MRRLVVGVVLGLILGTAGQAWAMYLTDGRGWYRLDRQAQTAYVAGVADSLESIAGFSQRAGAERTVEGVRQAAGCANRIPLHDLARFGSDAIDRGRHVLPSTALIEQFVACGRANYGTPYNQPYYWNPGGQPYYWGPNGQPLNPGKEPGEGK